ncbi:MAG: glycosyltransferase family 4 protein [Proteobacteria bacterium]|nr:glycosyltransferase family 4 protein [Pseudomonadota bacterium]
MIHVAIDALSWDNERGFGRFTRSLVAALAARGTGFRYTLLCDRAPERPVPAGVDVVIAGAGKGMADAASGAAARRGADMLTMSRAAAALKAELFFFPASYSFYPIPSLVPKLVCIHDTIPERFPDLIFPTGRNFRLWQAKTWVAKFQARRILTVSEASANDIARMLRIPRRRIDVTTEGAEPVFRPITDPATRAAARARHGIAEGDRVLTYIGGFNRHKNVASLIAAMPAILERVPGARLVIIGRTTGARFWDNIEELQETARTDARASGRIGFAGELDDEEMATLLSLSDALVMPSLWEGFGLPALEAMSSGTPVLASDRGSLPEVVGDGGLYFDPADKDALAAEAIRLLTEPGLAADLKARALARARTFGWDKAAALTEASFRRTIDSA